MLKIEGITKIPAITKSINNIEFTFAVKDDASSLSSIMVQLLTTANQNEFSELNHKIAELQNENDRLDEMFLKKQDENAKLFSKNEQLCKENEYFRKVIQRITANADNIISYEELIKKLN